MTMKHMDHCLTYMPKVTVCTSKSQTPHTKNTHWLGFAFTRMMYAYYCFVQHELIGHCCELVGHLRAQGHI